MASLLSRMTVAAVGFFCALVAEAVAPEVVPTKKGAVWYPADAPSFSVDGCSTVLVKDWRGREIVRRNLADGERFVRFSPGDFGGRFGAFEVVAMPTAGSVTNANCWFARLTGPNPLPCKWVGANTWWLWNRKLKDREDTSVFPYDVVFYDQLSAAGIGRVRYERVWNRYEPKPGEYDDCDAFREFVDEICRRGIEHHCILACNSMNRRAYPERPLDPEAYARCLVHMVETYRGKIKTFEITNEPQNTGFVTWYCFGGDNDAWIKGRSDGKRFGDIIWGDRMDVWVKPFVDFTRNAADAARRADPTVNVSVAVEDVEVMLNRMIELGIAKEEDIVSFHPYCKTQLRPEREWFFRDGGADLRERMRKHGGARRLMISETGWTTVSTTNMLNWFVGKYPRATYEQQARYMVRMYLLARQFGVECALEHNFVDNGPNRRYTEHNFGIIHGDFTPKPAYSAIAYLTRLLGESEPAGALSDEPNRYRIYRFEKNGKTVLAAWSVEGNVDIVMPAVLDGIGAVRDLMGNDARADVVDGRTLHLTENPVYLRVTLR